MCDKHLKHGDWRGQRVWQVPTATLTRHFDDIVVMLQAAAVTCSEEPAVVRLQQPCHVFGDIHGNFSDLKYFESLLWPLGVPFTAGSFLWLGDYVDRGACARAHFCVSALDYVYLILVFRVQALRQWRPSCISPVTTQPSAVTKHSFIAAIHPRCRYMLCLKVLYPSKWFLLRGNHEARDMNGWLNQYGASSFHHQCVVAFGDINGSLFYELVNNVFDCMPVAAVISDQVFCCHGGIPDASTYKEYGSIEQVTWPVS